MKTTRLLLAVTLATFAFSSYSADSVSSASRHRHKKPKPVATENYDAVSSASIVPASLRQSVKASGFTDSSAKKVLMVVGDPRHESVEWDLVNTAIAHFQARGLEVELRDLYAIHFNPVVTRETFFHAKDGFGKTPPGIGEEQAFVSKADYIVFCYPNWHDSPNAITKGYIERVFSKQFAYRDTEEGLEGLLKGKSLYTIMNAGWVGQGRGDVGDGIGKTDAIWDKYLNAYKVVDDDTSGFWGMKNLGRFVNDQTPKNNDPEYAQKIEVLRGALKAKLDTVFGLK